MGSLQAQPEAVLDVQISQVGSSPEQDAAWLDGILASSGPVVPGGWDSEDMRLRLRAMPLDIILAAVGRAARPTGSATEILLYREWIQANPESFVAGIAWFNLGVALVRTSEPANAIIAYRNALLLRPDLHAAAVNLGLLFEEMGETDEALTTWGRAIQPDDVRVALGIQTGRLLEQLGRFDEAERALYQVLLTDPAQPDVIHHWVHLRQKTCHWPATPGDVPGLSAEQLLRGSGPLGILALTDDIRLQREAAASWVIRKTEPPPQRLAPRAPYDHARIRIGYMSSDFCSHAMSYLITELFERHDRHRFEVFGYCSSRDDGTQLRQRVLAAFDHHRLIRTQSDEAVARLIRADEIDVLIDLNGLTEGSRLAALRWKPAPIQATYLGFIGPLPMPELDYLFCDTTVVPPEHQSAYQPKTLPIASIYQVNDSKRTIGRPLTRAEVGLPENCFVFCCMSRHYKITETIFAGWMSILHQVDGSVLWLASDNRHSEASLKEAARRAGLAEGRLIISERADPDLYLSRLALADLFLDTFPYNAGTVASDAMRMQLPIVTLCGAAFASRMATSLLRMIGATAGIATSVAQYVETAVRLARDPERYQSYKALFTTAAWQGTVGNIARFTAEYEATIAGIVTAAKSAEQVPAAALPPLSDDGWAEGFRQAVQSHQEGRLDQAERLYRTSLRSRFAPAGAFFNFGVLCMELERSSEAAEAFRRALTLQPDMVDAIVNLGTALLGMGRADEAIAAYRRALAISPDNAMAYGNLGKSAAGSGPNRRGVSGLPHVARSSAAERRGADRSRRRAAGSIPVGRGLAVSSGRPSRSDQTRCHGTRQPCRRASWDQARMRLRLAACQQAIALDPQGAAIACTLGGTMLELGEVAEAALPCAAGRSLLIPLLPARVSISAMPARRSTSWKRPRPPPRPPSQRSPASAFYHFHLAHTLLLQGKMDNGDGMNTNGGGRFPSSPNSRPCGHRLPQPPWNGEDISDKNDPDLYRARIGRHHSVRALPASRYRAGKARHTGCQRRNAPPAIEHRRPCRDSNPRRSRSTASTSTARFSACRAPSGQADRYDPCRRPLSAGRSTGGGPLGGTDRRRRAARRASSGLAIPATKRDRFRSPRLRSLKKLFAVPGITFVSLQMGAGRQDLRAYAAAGAGCRSWWTRSADLADTAAIMAGLDVMISSCTAPLHLAGAIGTPDMGE